MTTFVMFNDYKKGITIEVPNYRPRFACNQYDYRQIKFEFLFKAMIIGLGMPVIVMITGMQFVRCT